MALFVIADREGRACNC